MHPEHSMLVAQAGTSDYSLHERAHHFVQCVAELLACDISRQLHLWAWAGQRWVLGWSCCRHAAGAHALVLSSRTPGLSHSPQWLDHVHHMHSPPAAPAQPTCSTRVKDPSCSSCCAAASQPGLDAAAAAAAVSTYWQIA